MCIRQKKEIEIKIRLFLFKTIDNNNNNNQYYPKWPTEAERTEDGRIRTEGENEVEIEHESQRPNVSTVRPEIVNLVLLIAVPREENNGRIMVVQGVQF